MTDEHSHSHSHDHEHGQDHGHSHSHAVTDLSKLNRAFMLGILVNLVFVVVEVVYGSISGSIALLADAGHNFQDVLSLALSAFSLWLAQRPASKERTYGYSKSTILSSLANSILLVFACAVILWESFHRLHAGIPVDGDIILKVALVGVAVNGVSAFFFFGDRNEMNSRGAFLHLMMDALVSFAVAISGYLVLKTGLVWIDPAVSILVAAVILYSTWNLLTDSLDLALDRVPQGMNVDEVKSLALALDGVLDLHHIHIWPLSTFENAMTAHVVVSADLDQAKLIRLINEEVQEHFPIHHITLQIELKNGDSSKCPSEGDHESETEDHHSH
jgi:cobalt-zinc-cadmium efflux system protein